MAAAYQSQSLQGHKPGAWALLHAATRGAAQALALDAEIGSLADGSVADVCVWDWSVGPVGARRDGAARNLHERLFAWLTLADERHLVQAFVAGHSRFERPATMPPREDKG
jgi:guanine deaminase